MIGTESLGRPQSSRMVAKLSFFGALGFTLSAVLSFLLHRAVRTMNLELGLSLFLQGLCSIPAGVFLTFSLVLLGEKLQARRPHVIAWGALGGFVYGVLGVFSIWGGAAGVIALGLCIAAPTQKWRVFFPFPILTLALFSLIWTGDLGFNIVAHLFYPAAIINVAPTMTLILLAGFGYSLNCVVLVMLLNDSPEYSLQPR